MPTPYTFSHTVLEEEIDRLGHVNNLAYLSWMQAAAIAHSSAKGWPVERYERLGAGWVVRSHHIEYLRAAVVADRIEVRTWVAEMKRVSSLRRYEIVRVADDRTLAKAATDWAFVNYKTGLPARIPEEIIGLFQPPQPAE